MLLLLLLLLLLMVMVKMVPSKDIQGRHRHVHSGINPQGGTHRPVMLALVVVVVVVVV